ncbi:hypothetical protein Vretimale_2720 [Volvox reticuliferus]|uniref:Uncharacterized protein n=1 Tax=Volvox reticuliferus TaxID=1737510 RepID=A0A8J4BXV6_9CHLO|nr:hypothetical protein Vretifemale_1973 [Volvox reticuliferus]GIL96994.1 hypothetical protein Vretimale_2720 [Volvox reticuliferus]
MVGDGSPFPRRLRLAWSGWETPGVAIGPSLPQDPFGKHSSKDNHRLNLAWLPNVLDGVVDTPNRMTTNPPDKLDPALCEVKADATPTAPLSAATLESWLQRQTTTSYRMGPACRSGALRTLWCLRGWRDGSAGHGNTSHIPCVAAGLSEGAHASPIFLLTS